MHHARMTHLPMRYAGVQYLPVLTVQDFFNFCNVNDPFLARKTFNIKSL